jgi:hypothetical protein
MTETERLLGAEFARDCFDYRDGVLYWSMTRPEDHFGRYSDYVTFQKKTAGKPAGRKAEDGHISIKFRRDGKSVQLSASRIVWMLHYGDWPEHKVGHINGDPSDNRIENLRDAERAWPFHSPAGKSTSLQTVVARKDGRYEAQIRIGYRKEMIGVYDSAAAAQTDYRQTEAMLRVMVRQMRRIRNSKPQAR